MKYLLFFFSIALASCGTTTQNEFMSSYNAHGRQYGNQIISRSGINTMTRAKMPTRRVNTTTSTGGTMCPNSNGTGILKPATGPMTNPKTFKVDLFNEAVKNASGQRTTKRIIFN